MKFGAKVIYDGGLGKERLLGIVVREHDDGTVDIRWWDLEVGDSGYVTNAPRSDSGGGHSWRPIG